VATKQATDPLAVVAMIDGQDFAFRRRGAAQGADTALGLQHGVVFLKGDSVFLLEEVASSGLSHPFGFGGPFFPVGGTDAFSASSVGSVFVEVSHRFPGLTPRAQSPLSVRAHSGRVQVDCGVAVAHEPGVVHLAESTLLVEDEPVAVFDGAGVR